MEIGMHGWLPRSVNNMDKFIAQKDEWCGQCGDTIYTGSWLYCDGWGNVRCVECYEKEEFAEQYG